MQNTVSVNSIKCEHIIILILSHVQAAVFVSVHHLVDTYCERCRLLKGTEKEKGRYWRMKQIPWRSG